MTKYIHVGGIADGRMLVPLVDQPVYSIPVRPKLTRLSRVPKDSKVCYEALVTHDYRAVDYVVSGCRVRAYVYSELTDNQALDLLVQRYY